MKDHYITNNLNRGFYGTLKDALKLSHFEAANAYTMVGKMIAETHQATSDEVVLLLDSSTGRHIADVIIDTGWDKASVEKVLKGRWHGISRQLRENAEGRAAQHRALTALLTHMPAARHPEIHRAYRTALEGIQELRQVLQNSKVEEDGDHAQFLLEVASQVEEMLKG